MAADRNGPIRAIVSAILVAALVAGAVLLAQRFIRTRDDPDRRPTPQALARVVAPALELKRNHTVRLEGFGTSQPRTLVRIIPQVGGLIVDKADNFKKGLNVTQGKTLLAIEQTDYRQTRAAAEAQIQLLEAQLARLTQEEANLQQLRDVEAERIALAEEQLKRARKLLEANAASVTDVDALTETLLQRRVAQRNILNQLELLPAQRKELAARLQSAQVDLARAQTALERATVTAPIDGRVLSVSVEEEDVVRQNEVCGEIYDTRFMEIPVSLPAGDLQWIDPDKLGACRQREPGTEIPPDQRIPATVTWTPPGSLAPVVWNGCVDRMEPGLDPQTRTIRLVVLVDNEKQKTPLPLDVNTAVNVTIHGRTIESVFVLPRSAIVPPAPDHPWPSVYVAKEGKLTRRQVEVVRFTDDSALILPDQTAGDDRGLREGTFVITSEVVLPVIGMKVKPYPSQEALRNGLADKGDETEPAPAAAPGREG